MSTEKKLGLADLSEENLIESTQKFWSRYSKYIVSTAVAAVVLIAGYYAYWNFIQLPKETEANEAIWTAQSNFKIDSFRLALNGDGTKVNPGFLKVINKHGGTQAANLAEFYAGICFLQLGEYPKAVEHLKAFSTDDPVLQMRQYGSLGDAYSEQGKNEEAISNYKKAAAAFTTDEANSAEYLFRLGHLYEKLGKEKDAIEAFTTLKQKFPLSLRASEVDKYLGRLGQTQ